MTDKSDEMHPLPRIALHGSVLSSALAVLSGIPLTLAYSSSAGRSHQSLEFIAQHEPAIRNLHHWASALAILLGLLFAITALFTGSHRRPFQAAWIAGLLWIGCVLAFQLTGHLLPWDKHAVSTTVIETSIAGGVPGGSPLMALMRAGDSVGPATLNRWFDLHIALSILWLALATYLTRSVKPLRLKPLIPVVGILVLSSLLSAPLGPAAGPTDYESFAAKPEWYILPLHSLLGIFEKIDPSLGYVGSAVIPGLMVLFLVAMPWLDRGSLGKPVAAVLTCGCLLLFAYGISEVAPPVGNQMTTATSGGLVTALDPRLVTTGKQLFTTRGCVNCHKVLGKGGKTGPDLTDEATRHPDLTWQTIHLKTPEKVSPGSTMPAFDNLPDSDLKALGSYVLSKK